LLIKGEPRTYMAGALHVLAYYLCDLRARKGLNTEVTEILRVLCVEG
jgi:hypothetical protein